MFILWYQNQNVASANNIVSFYHSDLFIFCCTSSYVTKKIQTLGAIYATRGTTPANNPPSPSSFNIFDAHAMTDPPYAFVTSVIINVLIRSSGLVMAAENDPAAAPHIAASNEESDTSTSADCLRLARMYRFFVTSNVVSWATRNGTSL